MVVVLDAGAWYRCLVGTASDNAWMADVGRDACC
jgi:hypothetical protein